MDDRRTVQNPGGLIPQRERLLLEASRRGDQEAFGALIRESAPTLERLALRLVGHRHDAEDVAQETVLAAWRKLPGFRGRSRFKTWICKILVRRALSLLRRKRPVLELRPQERAAVSDPVASAQVRELDEAVTEAIEGLPPVQRATILLRSEQGLSYSEIAYVLGSTRNNVRSNLVAARKKLAEKLRDLVDLDGGAA